MALIKWTPFYEPFLDIEKAFNEFPAMPSSFSPAIDMYEKDNNLVVDVALTGIDPKDVSISIEDNVLNIEGKNEKSTEIDEKNYYRKEVRSGAFHRVISLPAAVNAQETTAEYTKGLLKITMPKKEELKPKSIEIKINK